MKKNTKYLFFTKRRVVGIKKMYLSKVLKYKF